jgi:cytochrome b561
MKTYSSLYRALHWAMAIAMFLILGTIFLRLTWLNKFNVSQIIQEYLSTTQQSLTEEESILLAKKIRQPMWDWHIYLGYALVGIFSLRFLLALFGVLPIQYPWTKGLQTKERFQNIVYIVFYIFITVSLVTGMLIKFGPKTWKHNLEEIHELSIYYLVVYLILHLGGVLMAEFTDKKGIISNIISGKKEEE